MEIPSSHRDNPVVPRLRLFSCTIFSFSFPFPTSRPSFRFDLFAEYVNGDGDWAQAVAQARSFVAGLTIPKKSLPSGPVLHPETCLFPRFSASKTPRSHSLTDLSSLLWVVDNLFLRFYCIIAALIYSSSSQSIVLCIILPSRPSSLLWCSLFSLAAVRLNTVTRVLNPQDGRASRTLANYSGKR
ncbi:hypothetical protein DL93DRAFT_276147 [Clavulina sp. PMI_390]|nr:hypothetical protein DL93DRAFT_276147 [Clavulina sp. PMI_390]